MLGLVYLTSVAGLIATSAVLHQLSLSRSGQSLLAPPAELSPTHLQTPDMIPDAPAVSQHLPCCVLANKSLNHQTSALGLDQHHRQNPPSASSQTSILCLWGSLLASVGHIHPQTSQAWSAASFLCPGCLATLPPLQCGLRNTSSLFTHVPLDDNHRNAPCLTSKLFGSPDSSQNSRLGAFPPVPLGRCHPGSILPVDKAHALLMSG